MTLRGYARQKLESPTVMYLGAAIGVLASLFVLSIMLVLTIGYWFVPAVKAWWNEEPIMPVIWRSMVVYP